MRIIPSIEFIPGKSNVGSALSVIGPDFTFSRTTTPVAGVATRVNASGLIETVPDNVLRLDYPIGGGCPAALIEPAATNLAFNLSGYSLSNATTGSLVTSPDGTANAITFIESSDAAATNHQITTNTITFVSGNTYTYSVFFKAGNNNRSARLALPSGLFVGAPVAFFDITSGSVLNASDCTASVQNYGNGWFRCIITAVSDSSGTNNSFLNLASGATRDYIGNGSGSILAWGAQIETGAIPTSYIPTTTGSATRAAEVCSVSGVSGYIGQTQGTIYWEGEIPSTVNSKGILLQIGSSTNRVYISRESVSTLLLQLGTQSSAGYNFLNYTASSNILKVAVAYASGNNAFYVNGVQVSTASATANPSSAFTEIFIQDVALPDTTQRIRAAALYTTRLDNYDLMAMTSLDTSYEQLAARLSYAT